MTIERKIYCCWFGGEMSENRKLCYTSIVQNSGIPVCLITENNLSLINDKNYPIHAGFQYLSSTHKADYLRAYLMYTVGGGYTDIKNCNYNWEPYFKELENSIKAGISCKCTSEKQIAYKPYRSFYSNLSGLTPLIFKPKSTFAKEWLINVNNLIDKKFEQLKLYPGTYHPRAVLGGVQGEPGKFIESLYPFRWTDLLGKIFHRLQYDYKDDFLYNMPPPDMNNYR